MINWRLVRFRISPIQLAIAIAFYLISQFSLVNMSLLISEYIEGSSNNKAIELYNSSDNLIDLGANGYTLEFYFNGNDTAGTVINLTGAVETGEVFVVADDNADSAILEQTDFLSTQSFFNGDDAIVLRENGLVVDSLGQIGIDPGSEWGSGEISTQNNTLRRNSDITQGDNNPNNVFDPSLEWSGFANDTFDGLGVYQGTNGGGENPDLVAIYDIQGAGHNSSFTGQQVATAGIVTAVDARGFYLQDPTGDNNLATSDAIFVFTNSAPGVRVGDELEVSGTVSEFIPGGADTGNLSITQITNPTVTTLSSNNTLPDAVIIGNDGRIPPAENIDDDAFASFDPNTDGIDFFESLEGMLVTAKDTVAVGGTTRFGEIFTVVDGGTNVSGISDRFTLNISPDDFNPEKVQIDANSDILPGFDFPEVNAGDSLGDVTGVVTYSFGNFEINPTQPFSVTDTNLIPEITSIQSGEDTLTIASYNVLNLDPNDSDGDTDVANGRFEAIASQIVNNLNSPDIIGLQEIQDSSGSSDNGVVDADATLQQLVEAIAAEGGGNYEYIDNTFIGDGTSGGQPGGNIRNAFLYKSDRVTLDPDSVESIQADDQQTNPNNPFFDSRLPLVATFDFNGQEVKVVNNHFSSKGGSSPIFGVEQPFEARQEDPSVNGSLDERQAQAQGVKDYVDAILTSNSDANIFTLGDLNEFEFVSPVDEILGSSLHNLVDTLPEDERYSFIFQGNSQTLDHILISDSLLDSAEFDMIHVNSEFAETPSRASDHDPILASVNLTTEISNIEGTSRRDNLVGTDNNNLISGFNGKDILSGLAGNDTIDGGNGKDTLYGGAGNDVLSGGNGKDVFVYTNLGEGTDTIIDFATKQDQLDLNAIFSNLGDISNFTFKDSLQLVQSGSDTIIKLDSDDILAILENVNTNDLSETNFII